VAVRNVVAPALQPEPASRLRSATRDVSFLRSDSRCRRYVSDLRRKQGFVVEVDFQLTFGFLVGEMEDCRHRFRGVEL